MLMKKEETNSKSISAVPRSQQTNLFTDDRWSEYTDILLHLPTYYMYQYSDPVVDVL